MTDLLFVPFCILQTNLRMRST